MKPLSTCKKCALYKGCTFVKGTLPSKAPLLIVGEAPGREEALAGMPFMGRSGKLLRFIINKLGIKEDSVAFTYAVKCAPTEKLPTRKKERANILSRCRPLLLDEISGRTVLCLGAIAMEQMSGKSAVATFEGRQVLPNVFVSYAPSFVLRNHWEERKLAVAVYAAAKSAGLEPKVQVDGKLFDYNNFQ